MIHPTKTTINVGSVDAVAGVGIEVPAQYRSDPRREVRALLPALKPGLKVLEIGCGEGNFCLELPNVAEAWGIEPHAASASVARRRLHTVFTSTFEEARSIAERLFAFALLALSAGKARDMWFLQIGFLASPPLSAASEQPAP